VAHDDGSKGDDEGPKIITDIFYKQPPGDEGRCLLAAGQQYEEAYALIAENHSIFTHYLLKGLKGEKRSIDDNGNVIAFTLGRYIFNTISSLDPKNRTKTKSSYKSRYIWRYCTCRISRWSYSRTCYGK
jgi:hypothetical protein